MDLETQEQDVTTSVEEGCFSILMGADIQYPWLRAPVKGDNKEISKSMTRQYFLGMSKLTKLKTGCV
uniref:Uncharacterized protein n=1 Tax=Romanomermis culicivorax TaxID=13658 RepID=A0A915JX52_ROMCU